MSNLYYNCYYLVNDGKGRVALEKERRGEREKQFFRQILLREKIERGRET